MKKILTISLILFCFFARADVVFVKGFQGKQQEKSNWCWAASIQAVLMTDGLNVSQRSIVRSAYGSEANLTAPGFEGTLKLLNGLAVGDGGDSRIVRASAFPSYPDSNWLLGKLKNGEPVIVWYRDESSNHSIIINGGDYYLGPGGAYWEKIFAFDPYFNKNMVIVGSNIPRYVYGSFDVKISSGIKDESVDDELTESKKNRPKAENAYKVPDWMK